VVPYVDHHRLRPVDPMADRIDEISAAIDRLEVLIEQMNKVGSEQVVILLQAARIELLNALNEETEARR
jgi:hypothetical protein